MQKIVVLIILITSTITKINLAQYPDTIIIKAERVKGYGPFQTSYSYLQPLSSDNPWINAVTKYYGIPENLENLVFCTEQTDFLQYTYQNFYANTIDEELFNSCKLNWNWNPSPLDYTKELVKVDIGAIAGYDTTGELRIKIDKNNNYDFSDDEYFSLPQKIPGQNFWGRYSDLRPFEVNYEYYDGKSIKNANTWIYVDYSEPMYYSKSEKPYPIALVIGFAEYHLGEFSINGKKYWAAVKSDRATFRGNYKIKLWSENDTPNNLTSQAEVSRNGFIKIEDIYYRFDSVNTNGSEITLIKDRSVLEMGGNQVGLNAINFVSKSISGNVIELDKLRGNYVYLDFWGTWCSPCREEIPKLKSLFEEYKNTNFVIIGIANDDIESLRKFIEENEVQWQQIIQSEDKSIISDYSVTGYPTTFLIDPDGKIIDKNLRANDLSKKLSQLFSQ